MKIQSPLLGYNNNVRHKNRVFHIQTEDSGVKHPHIITHLFMDGGRILKSVKRSYAEHVGAEGMSDLVRGMMKEQHKSMLIALRDGQYDYLVDDPKAVAAKAAATAAAATARAAEAPPAKKSASVAPPAPEPPRRPSRLPPPAVVASSVIHEGARAPADEGPATTRSPNPELTLDIDALERAAKDAETTSPLFQPTHDLPPPPQSLFRDKPTTGGYRSVTPPPMERISERPPPNHAPSAPSAPSAGKARASTPPNPRPPSNRAPASQPPRPANKPPSRPAAAQPPAGQGRYAPARPAAIFGQSQSRPQTPASIFGEDLISDKSLDEVILSYLAEDLEPSEKK